MPLSDFLSWRPNAHNRIYFLVLCLAVSSQSLANTNQARTETLEILNIAQEKISANQLEDAFNLVNELSANIEPDSTDEALVLQMLGDIATQSNNHKDAVDYYQKAMNHKNFANSSSYVIGTFGSGGNLEGFDTEAFPVKRIAPKYPARALQAGLEGYVSMDVIINSDGSVAKVFVTDSNPRKLFDKAAINAMEQWEFRPKVVDGQPQAHKAQQVINFTLGR